MHKKISQKRHSFVNFIGLKKKKLILVFFQKSLSYYWQVIIIQSKRHSFNNKRCSTATCFLTGAFFSSSTQSNNRLHHVRISASQETACYTHCFYGTSKVPSKDSIACYFIRVSCTALYIVRSVLGRVVQKPIAFIQPMHLRLGPVREPVQEFLRKSWHACASVSVLCHATPKIESKY